MEKQFSTLDLSTVSNVICVGLNEIKKTAVNCERWYCEDEVVNFLADEFEKSWSFEKFDIIYEQSPV